MDGVKCTVQRLRVFSDELSTLGPAGPGVEEKVTQVDFARLADVPVGRDPGAPELMDIVGEPRASLGVRVWRTYG
jgi:hypothetical protein